MFYKRFFHFWRFVEISQKFDITFSIWVRTWSDLYIYDLALPIMGWYLIYNVSNSWARDSKSGRKLNASYFWKIRNFPIFMYIWWGMRVGVIITLAISADTSLYTYTLCVYIPLSLYIYIYNACLHILHRCAYICIYIYV